MNRCWWKHAELVWLDLTGRSVASWWCEVDGLGVILTGQIEIKCNYGWRVKIIAQMLHFYIIAKAGAMGGSMCLLFALGSCFSHFSRGKNRSEVV